MRTSFLLTATAVSALIASPAWAQDAPPANPSAAAAQQEDTSDTSGAADGRDLTPEIIVTAQRQAQRLQDVPIAVTAFTGESLEKQQIQNPSDLQLSIPNVSFTKTNFTASSFTIRGIGDLCTGVTCDQATAVHLNEEPLFATRLFETEFYDIERIEVLRGPQGTLYGRNATSGVVNVVSAKPDPSRFSAGGEFEYGNYNSIRAKGAINLPIGDRIAVRVAGYYLNRDGYTLNIYNGDRYDDRDLYSVRGSIRFEPTADTTIDLLGQYFHEKDNRLRIQKQLCQRDPTGVLGCLAGRLDNGVTNGNASFVGTLTSAEFLRIRGIPTIFALGSLYGPDAYTGSANPADLRQVNTDYTPTYFADELILQGRIQHDFGNFHASLTGTYQDNSVDSSQDYNLSVQNRALYAPALNALAAAAAGQIPGLPASYFAPIANALIPQGPNGPLCTSLAETTGTGAYGGYRFCSNTPQDFDRSNEVDHSYSVEGIVSSDFAGPFNFLLGAIYSNRHTNYNNYYVNSFGIDYLSGILGTFTALGNPAAAGGPLPPSYLATPYYRNNTADYRLKSYGIFGEAYVQASDRLKLTLGLRYNNDDKSVIARNTLASFLAPFGSTDAFASPFFGAFDADPGVAGNQAFQVRQVSFSEFTGRAVVDFQVTPDNLLYFSYSRGYKSGGINPPLANAFLVPESFQPEFINAFEVGSKNTLAGGRLILNLTAFYYQYKGLQLSRIVNRTSVNDNVDADIYGVEAEAIVRPVPALTINLTASYLHTRVSSDKFLANPRDPGGGRADAVIIKDITNGANCAVTSRAGSAAGANAFVGAINASLGLRPPTGFGPGSGLNSTGAFGICSVLEAQARAIGGAFGGIDYFSAGVPVNIRGNELPQAPRVKTSVGVQYNAAIGGGFELVPRFDVAFTGEQYASIFNLPIDRIPSFVQANAQIQLNAPNDRFFVRGFVQNIFDDNSITGQYVTDASSGLFTNVFTLEPRRYGVAVGFKF